MILDKIEAFGHPNVLSTHKTTLEFTKDNFLTLRGDCIVGINSNKSIAELSNKFKDFVKKERKIRCKIKTKSYEDNIVGYGNQHLTLDHPKDIVLRKSKFICPRTLLINCNKAAYDINRDLIEELKNKEKLEVIFELI